MKLDRLIALNDEIVSLSRAGVPLGAGLLCTTSDLPSRLGRIADELGTRLEQGETLETAVRANCDFPPLYAAVVAAGTRSGRLTAGLEGLSTSLRRMAELRRAVSCALLYPIVVLVVALLLFVFVVSRTIQPLDEALTAHRVRVEGGWLEAWLEFISAHAIWLVLAPLLIVGAYVVWQWSTGRTHIARISHSNLAYAWLPGGARLIRMGQLATFTNVLSLLVDQDVPMPEAVLLAAEAADGRDLRRDAEQLSKQLKLGSASQWKGTPRTGLPTLIGWMTRGSLASDDLAPALGRMSESYGRQAQELGNWLRSALPGMATLFLAGVATFAYAAASIIPWLAVLYRIGTSV